MIYVIVALSRPEQINNVINNFKQQIYNNKKLIIIENGKAINCCKTNNFKPDVLLSSENHQSCAKNEGIQWIKNNGGGWWTTFDDDDYYGPGYLSKTVSALSFGNIIGQSNIFMKTISGNIRLFTNLELGICNGVHGSTITARAEDCPYFEDTGKWGEDWDFIERYKSSGAICFATNEYGHILIRHKSNTWQVSDESMVRRFHFASGGQCIVKDFGKENNESINIVNGKISNNFTIIKPNGEFGLEDSAAYQILKEKIQPIDEFLESMKAYNT